MTETKTDYVFMLPPVQQRVAHSLAAIADALSDIADELQHTDELDAESAEDYIARLTAQGAAIMPLCVKLAIGDLWER